MLYYYVLNYTCLSSIRAKIGFVQEVRMLLQKCKQSLLDHNINPISSIEYDINGEIHTISLEWIIEAFLKTEKKELFMELFKKVLKGSDSDIEQFFQQMGQLILMSSLSEQVEAVGQTDFSPVDSMKK